VVDPRRLLAAVTTDAAKAVGLDDTLGSITVGKAASLVVVDMSSRNLAGSVNPLASLVERATAADIRAVLVDGAVVHGAI
jgi:5-methylthioadenosine/S-adenosylhomocysteine deaminase